MSLARVTLRRGVTLPLLLKQAIWISLIGSALLAAIGAAPHRRLAVDVARSWMTVYVYKEGIFSFAADNHEVDVPISSGSFDPQHRRVELDIDAKRMRVLDPPNRKDKVQANMDGPAVLDSDRYPTILFRSTNIAERDSRHWTVVGDLTLHGQTHPIQVSAISIDPFHFTGSAIVKQTAFGITPIRIAGGTVRVKDDVQVNFDVVLK